MIKKLNKKVTSNKTKHLLAENKFKNYRHLIQVFLWAKVDGAPFYLIF